MGHPVKLLAPVAAERAVSLHQGSGDGGLAPRPTRGRPLLVGLLDNIKPNARLVLEAAWEALAARGIAGTAVRKAKAAAGSGMSPEIFDELARCDVVLTALAC